jgi:hypothetical protein
MILGYILGSHFPMLIRVCFGLYKLGQSVTFKCRNGYYSVNMCCCILLFQTILSVQEILFIFMHILIEFYVQISVMVVTHMLFMDE